MFNQNTHAIVLDILNKVINILTKLLYTMKLIRINNNLG